MSTFFKDLRGVDAQGLVKMRSRFRREVLGLAS